MNYHLNSATYKTLSKKLEGNNLPSIGLAFSRVEMVETSGLFLSRDKGEGQLLEAAALRVGDRLDIF